MSLTMLLRNSEGLVMAADSRVTTGYTLNGPKTSDDSVKFIQLNPDVGVMTHGIFDIGTKGINSLKTTVSSNSKQELSFEKIIEKGRKIFIEINNNWTKENPQVKRRKGDVGFTIAGLNRQNMQFEVYVFENPEFNANRIKGNFFLAGQWHIAKFLLNKLNAETIPINTLKNLAGLLLTATSSVDKTVGGPVRIATITEEKGFQWAGEGEMADALDFKNRFCIFFQGLLKSSLCCFTTEKNQK